jgi:hypothetical protein
MDQLRRFFSNPNFRHIIFALWTLRGGFQSSSGAAPEFGFISLKG